MSELAERKWHRLGLGVAAFVLLAAGLVMTRVQGQSSNGESYYSGMFIKIGIVLGVAWLAAPQLERLGWHRLRGTLLVSLIVVLVLWAIRPRIGAWAAAILIGGGIFFSLIGWVRNLFDMNPGVRNNKRDQADR